MSEPISDAELFQLMAGGKTQSTVATTPILELARDIGKLRWKRRKEGDIDALEYLTNEEIAHRLRNYSRRMGLEPAELDVQQRLLLGILNRQWDLMELQTQQVAALGSVRSMMQFFTVLAVLSIILSLLF